MSTTTVKRIICGFWALWIGAIAATNLFSLLKALTLVGPAWRFASHNFELVRSYLTAFRLPIGVVVIAFAALVFWQYQTTWLFLRAAAAPADRRRANAAFGAGMALFAAFLVVGELVLRFDFEAIHMRIFMAQAISWMAIHLLPDD